MLTPATARKILRAADALEAFLDRNWRAVVVCLLAVALLLLSGCASYEMRQPVADRGTVLLTWEIGAVPGNHCGWAREIARDHYLITFRRKYDFDNPCWPHELGHAFGGDHQ